MCYELLFVEDGIYYLRYYVNNEAKGIDMKLSKEEFLAWQKGRLEKSG